MFIDPPILSLSFFMGDSLVLDGLRAAHGSGEAVQHDQSIHFNAPGCVGVSNGERIVYRGQTLTYWTSGQHFTGPNEAAMKYAFSTGRKLTKAFLRLCEHHAPVYGAITLLDDLQEPVELVRGGEPCAFQDFFLSDTWFHGEVRTRIQAMYADAFVDETAGGLYVSTNPWFNRPGKRLTREQTFDRSKRLSRLIVRTLKGTHLPQMW